MISTTKNIYTIHTNNLDSIYLFSFHTSLGGT